MSINVSQIAQAIPSVLSAGGVNASLNALLLSESTLTPVGSALSFATAETVGQRYGYSSPEYEFAAGYFGGVNNAISLPGELLITQYPSVDVAAWLAGGSLASMTLAQLQALSGTITITVNGTQYPSSTISLSGATSFSNAATLIEAGFTSPPFAVSWSSQLNAFVFTSSTTGASSTIDYATGSLATSLLLTQAGGATASQGSAAATPATFMPTVLAITGAWAQFATTWEPALSDKVSFAQWTSGQNSGYAYVMFDTDPNNASSANFSQTATAAIVAAGYSGTIPIYGDMTHAAMVCSWAASLNFSQTNGRMDLAGISSPTAKPYVTDSSVAQQLVANGVNFYGDYANKGSTYYIFQTGLVTGQWLWADSYMNQIAFNDELESDQLALLTSGISIPYNAAGNALIESCYADTIQKYLNFGAIRTGVTLSSSQKQALYAKVGADVSAQIQTQGYYLYIGPETAVMRAARTSPPITLFYTDGGDVQQLIINSVEIQ